VSEEVTTGSALATRPINTTVQVQLSTAYTDSERQNAQRTDRQTDRQTTVS